MAAVEFKVDGNIAVVTLNRPEARNAVSPEVAVRLAKAWEEIKSNDQILIRGETRLQRVQQLWQVFSSIYTEFHS